MTQKIKIMESTLHIKSPKNAKKTLCGRSIKDVGWIILMPGYHNRTVSCKSCRRIAKTYK